MIIEQLQKLTGHDFVKIVSQGDAAIKSAVSLFEEIVLSNKILIPEEGGWLSYEKYSNQKVKCNNSKINIVDLKTKLETQQFHTFLYQNPGGYFAEQPMEEIYNLCHQFGCKVILDVSGGIGTKLCDGKFADIIVGSFGKWKLVDVGKGGFISCKEEELFQKLNIKELEDSEILKKIEVKLRQLPERIQFLTEKRNKVIEDVNKFNLENIEVISPEYFGFVVIVGYDSEEEKEMIISYCIKENVGYTECPRYIRINKKAISIEIKRL